VSFRFISAIWTSRNANFVYVVLLSQQRQRLLRQGKLLEFNVFVNSQAQSGG
jgi:hypothetical protein